MPADADLAKRAHAALNRVMERDASERRAFVRSEHANDPALMARLLELLDAADRSGSFLDRPALAFEPASDADIPDAVGNYLVVGVLGEGGMATVYEAVQEQPKRRVALKVLRKSMTHTDAYKRFRFETETLARLHHPGIAQIYEAGAARLDQAAPSPFFAMELVVNAAPITEHARRKGLSLRERVAMFASVCDAVHHGHRHGVIHRDLKPANVLVDGDGRAKVIDFGVARTTDAGAGSITSTSGFRQLIGTLNYMSPEQCDANADIDIRTDIYSLGVMLYELACGRLPHDLNDTPIPAALRAITSEPARRPALGSSRAERDLEAVILKAIDKDPDRRYQSAAALANDLRRWLRREAIEARPPGAIDQCLLFARRNRALVAAAVSGMAGVVLIAAVSTIMAVRLAKQVELRRAAEASSIAERDAARWQAYTAQIAGALSAMKTGEFQQMRTRLAAASNRPDGWEWGFLSRLSERSVNAVVAHDDMIMACAVDRAWTHAATAARDGSVRLWTIDAFEPIASYTSESGTNAQALCFTADDRHIVVGDDAGAVTLLDANNLRPIGQPFVMDAPVRGVVGLHDGRVLVADVRGRALVLDADLRPLAEFPDDQPGGVNGFELSPDGAQLATFNATGEVWLRNAADLSVIHRFRFTAPALQARFSRDGRLLGVAGESGRLFVWDVASGALVHDILAAGAVNTVRSLAFSNDGSLLAAGLVHRGVRVLSMRDGSVVGELGGHTEAVSALRFSPNDALLITASWDRTLRAWRTSEIASPSGTTPLHAHEDRIFDVAYAPDGSAVASASRDGSVIVWDPDLALPIARIHVGGGAVYGLAYAPDGRTIAAACADGAVRLVNASTGRVLASLTGNEAWVASVAFDRAGARVVSGGHDGTVRVWDVDTGEQRLVLRGHDARVNAVAFSPDGGTIASGSRDATVRLWDAATGEPLTRLDGHTSDVFAVLFSHDGAHLYSGSRDQSVRVWDPTSGELRHTLDGHGQFVTCLTLNADGTRLAAGSWFGEIILFDVPTHDLIASFRAHDAAIRGVAFSPDCRWLVSGSFDAAVHLFDSAPRTAADAARERAVEAFAEARQSIAPHVADAGSDPDAALRRLADAGLDPWADPWVRKATLATFSPPDAPSAEHPGGTP